MTQLYDREREMKLYVAEERKEEKMNTKVDDIKNLMKNLKLSAKEAMNALGIYQQDQKTYLPMKKKG